MSTGLEENSPTLVWGLLGTRADFTSNKGATWLQAAATAAGEGRGWVATVGPHHEEGGEGGGVASPDAAARRLCCQNSAAPAEAEAPRAARRGAGRSGAARGGVLTGLGPQWVLTPANTKRSGRLRGGQRCHVGPSA